ncbi:cytochrome P450 [Flagelloscypha sp. PMI_526]|nr:cytochrome P450 [Flagelloscypha sp. PMI_526]
MSRISLTEIGLVSSAVFLAYSVSSWFLGRRRRIRVATALRGPKPLHPIWGWTQEIIKTDHSAEMYEGWVKEFGSVVGVPTLLWNQRILLADPKAVAHFYAHDASVYVQNKHTKVLFGNLVYLLGADGEQHKRMRKTLTPAFSIAAIRRLVDVFYDSAHKVKSHWESILDSNGGEAIIEVQDWMNRISLDSIGTAGFGHEFNSIDGQPSTVVDLFKSFHNAERSIFGTVVFLLSIAFPRIFTKVPTKRMRLVRRFREAMASTAEELLNKTRQETKALGEYSAAEKSIIGLLVKAESATGALSMSKDEVTAQMNVLLLAGYETTSISLTWALIELARNPSIQEELRKEAQAFASDDPTYDELSSSSVLPFLDGVIHETLRLHGPVPETNRVATKDDILPLSRPYTTSNGTVVDRITIAKGSNVSAPIGMVNRSVDIWGPDAKEFKPSRWFDMGNKELLAKEFSGHRNLLTFADGPKMCLGKNFAVAEFKASLFVLVKFFSFEFPNGPQTEIAFQPALIKRPKVAGEEGIRVPLLVRRVE